MGQSFFYLVFFQSSRNFEKFNSIGIWRSKDLLIPWKIRRNAILEWKRYIPNLLQEESVKLTMFRVVNFYTTSVFEFCLIVRKVNSNKIIKTTAGRLKEALLAKGLKQQPLQGSHLASTTSNLQLVPQVFYCSMRHGLSTPNCLRSRKVYEAQRITPFHLLGPNYEVRELNRNW